MQQKKATMKCHRETAAWLAGEQNRPSAGSVKYNWQRLEQRKSNLWVCKTFILIFLPTLSVVRTQQHTTRVKYVPRSFWYKTVDIGGGGVELRWEREAKEEERRNIAWQFNNWSEWNLEHSVLWLLCCVLLLDLTVRKPLSGWCHEYIYSASFFPFTFFLLHDHRRVVCWAYRGNLI